MSGRLKLDEASKAGRGIELSASEVWLLMEHAGEAIVMAGDKFSEWQEKFRD